MINPLDFRVMQDVAKITRITAQARSQTILRFIQRIKSTPQAYKLLTDWGMTIADQTLPLQARVLDPVRA